MGSPLTRARRQIHPDRAKQKPVLARPTLFIVRCRAERNNAGLHIKLLAARSGAIARHSRGNVMSPRPPRLPEDRPKIGTSQGGTSNHRRPPLAGRQPFERLHTTGAQAAAAGMMFR